MIRSFRWLEVNGNTWIAWAILLAVLLFIFLGGVGFSQASISQLERLEVAFWPEYDRSAVLVIYRFLLPEDSPLPIAVQFDIPARVGEPHAVAHRSESTGELLDADYTLQVAEDWTTVTIQMEGLVGQLEFYDDLNIQADQRSYDFEWPGGVAVNLFRYEFQQPFGAENVRLEPSATAQAVGNDGLTYYRGEVGLPTVESSLRISFEYAKSDPVLTFNALQQLSPLSPVDAPQGRAVDWQSVLPYIIGGLGLLLIGFGSFLYLRPMSERRIPTQPRRRNRRSRRSGREVDPSPLYCHNCGTQADSGDRFCRQCGTKLRR